MQIFYNYQMMTLTIGRSVVLVVLLGVVVCCGVGEAAPWQRGGSAAAVAAATTLAKARRQLLQVDSQPSSDQAEGNASAATDPEKAPTPQAADVREEGRTPSAATQSNVADNNTLFECRAPERRYVSDEVRQKLPHKKKPPLLLTLPGSGNTWFRLLLEAGTGFHTGSVYTDTALVDIMPGENTCGADTIVIKSHLHLKEFDPEIHHKLFEATPDNFTEHYPCRSVRPFETVIAVIRDPYHAALAETMRQLTKDHAKALTHDDLRHMPKDSYEPKLVTQAEMWALYMEEYAALLEAGWVAGRDIVLIRFEDMTSEYMKYDTLARLLNFVLGDEVASPHGALTQEALACVFKLSESEHVHRHHGGAFVTAEEVLTPDVVCRMWDKIRHVALAMEYKPPFGIHCQHD